MTITRRPPLVPLQRDSSLSSSKFMAEQFCHPREGLRQMHSLTSHSSIEPRFYRLGQDGRRKLYSQDISEITPIPHSSPSGAATNQPTLSLQTTNRRFATMISLAFAMIFLGVLLRNLYTQQNVSEVLLDHLHSITSPDISHSSKEGRIRALEEAVQHLTLRLDDTVQSLKESWIQATAREEAIQQLTIRLDDTAQSLANSCSAGRIQRTCLRLINEFTGEQNFALSSLGAKVVRELTTAMTELHVRSWLSWLQPQPPIVPLHTLPNSVLDGHVRAGDCWDMRKQAGQLGISLPHTVTITHVTIVHIPQELISDIERAPKHAVLWGVVDGNSNFKKVETLKILHPPEFRDMLSAREGPPTTAGYNYVPLAYITYNISREDWVQTIPVVQDIVQVTMDFGVVVLEVLDNWGGDSTCLYRVRIHGE